MATGMAAPAPPEPAVPSELQGSLKEPVRGISDPQPSSRGVSDASTGAANDSEDASLSADRSDTSSGSEGQATAERPAGGRLRQRRGAAAAAVDVELAQSGGGGAKAAAAPPRGDEAPHFTPGLATRALHLVIFASCVVMTRVVLSIRSLFALFVSGARTEALLERPGARLSWEMLDGAPDPCKVVKETLPVPPPLPTPPPEGLTISFGPCANLMIYTGGVAACLQRCPNYAEVAPKLRFYGVSCGAFIASTMAADCDILEMLPEMLSWTRKFQGRLWGLIGAYSESITSIVWSVFSDPTRFERAKGRLSIGVTAFTPQPERVVVGDMATPNDLVTALLGSCYIPVAFERPQWSPTMGPLWDGGIMGFATQGNIVVSPNECCLPDVFPKAPYPRRLVFFPPHERDAVHLFEDGYMDCLRWLEAGAPMRSEERQRLVCAGSGIAPLVAAARPFLWDILWGSPPSEERKP